MEKSKLVSIALQALIDMGCSEDELRRPNYSEICEICNFPDLQDGGIYEQAVDTAAAWLLEI